MMRYWRQEGKKKAKQKKDLANICGRETPDAFLGVSIILGPQSMPTALLLSLVSIGPCRNRRGRKKELIW